MPSIVVATFNIRTSRGIDGRHSWLLRRHATVAAIVGLHADIVALQEVRRGALRHLHRHLDGYVEVGVGRDDGRERGERCTVLFRPDRFELLHSETRWFSDTPTTPGSRTWGNRQPRIVTFAVLRDRSAGDVVAVANAHLDASDASLRKRSAIALTSWMDDLHAGRDWVVVGDLNATVAEPPLVHLLDSGLRDALSMLPAQGADAATGHGFSGAVDGRRIDHVLVGERWLVEEAEIVHDRPGGRLPSDHWPVRARLRRR